MFILQQLMKLEKYYLIADERVQGAVFDLPEEIAKELLNKQLPPGNTIEKITKLPALQDDGPPSDFYGGTFRRGGRSNSNENSRSWMSRSSGDDWLIGGRRSSRPSSRDRYLLFHSKPGHVLHVNIVV
ncbi:hypothetical protein NC653_035597 [Populus alba x Populus x berolinensis]|uniref:GUCT domain-containing protein n=1 Tax=Populus alba x Populus x berolinensis TaxID=444605 RepID=A0AAD6LQD7_9ROSI|nr:hypothetical protein NC653_035597 [Populus alba x Populus x berolinensis]